MLVILVLFLYTATLIPCVFPGSYRCPDNSYCIPQDWVCDDVNDCDDHSDELNCDNTNTTEGDKLLHSLNLTII